MDIILQTNPPSKIAFSFWRKSHMGCKLMYMHKQNNNKYMPD